MCEIIQMPMKFFTCAHIFTDRGCMTCGEAGNALPQIIH